MTDLVTITDTGKRRTSSGSVEETDLANGGTGITLHGVFLSVNDQAMLNTSPVLGQLTTTSDSGSKWNYGEVDTMGVMKPLWVARGLLRSDNTTDMALIKPLRDLVRTKGYKTVSGDIADWSGGTDTGGTVDVHVKSVKITQHSKHNIVEYSVQMVETT